MTKADLIDLNDITLRCELLRAVCLYAKSLNNTCPSHRLQLLAEDPAIDFQFAKKQFTHHIDVIQTRVIEIWERNPDLGIYEQHMNQVMIRAQSARVLANYPFESFNNYVLTDLLTHLIEIEKRCREMPSQPTEKK